MRSMTTGRLDEATEKVEMRSCNAGVTEVLADTQRDETIGRLSYSANDVTPYQHADKERRHGESPQADEEVRLNYTGPVWRGRAGKRRSCTSLQRP